MTTTNLIKGTKVYSSEHDELGSIAEVRADAFRVDIAMMPDYWLPASAVEGNYSDGVVLRYGKDNVGDHKLDMKS